MYRLIEQIVIESGIWDGGRRETHGFLLTPDVFPLPMSARTELEHLGPAITESLAGLGRIATIAHQRELAPGKTWDLLKNAVAMEVPRPHRELQLLKPSTTPLIVKVDFVEDAAGHLWIAEIDAMNRRAMGYATLFAAIREAVNPGASTLPGIRTSLGTAIKKRGLDQLVFLYGHRERFYLPEFHILRQALRSAGVELIVADEIETAVDGQNLIIRGERETTRTLVNFPVMTENPRLTDALADLYRKGEIKFLMPPKPFMGSKNLLAILSNPGNDADIEAILRSQMSGQSLQTIRQHLPETHLVTRHGALPNLTERYVLKETISAGTKGVAFSDDSRFEDTLHAAQRSSGRYILQRELKGRQREFRHYNANGELTTDERFTRLVVYFIERSPAEAVVTACRGRLVHGAKDALNMGVVFTD